MSASESDRIFAEGASLALDDGRTVPVRFGYRQLKALEDEFGSLQWIFDQLSNGMKGKLFATFLPALAIGTGLTLDDLLDNLSPRNASKHMEVFGAALQQAFPQEAQTMATPASPNGSGNVAEAGSQNLSSPGPSTITSLPYVSGEVTTSGV